MALWGIRNSHRPIIVRRLDLRNSNDEQQRKRETIKLARRRGSFGDLFDCVVVVGLDYWSPKIVRPNLDCRYNCLVRKTGVRLDALAEVRQSEAIRNEVPLQVERSACVVNFRCWIFGIFTDH